jgi:curved DNA-binding protein CbpA
MTDVEFIDYYETLEISPNANPATIDRMFRYFAQRYHPDNPETGDRHRFDVIIEAHNTLKHPATRAEYDLRYKSHLDARLKLDAPSNDSNGIGRDIDVQSKLLSILYVKRRQNAKDPGIGNVQLERLLDCPTEHLEFHVWYLKEKGWITRTEDGALAITVDGVDHANSEHQRKVAEKLLIARAGTA